jgi:hypothetical protein
VEQRELGRPEKPVAEAEQEVVMPSPDALVEALAGGGPLSPQGPTSTVIDLTSDDTPSNKGKQKADVEMVDASDQPRTSAAPDDDMAEASTRWPNFAELALMRTEDELPCWGRSSLEFRDATNPDAEPFFVLDDKDEVKYWEYAEGLCKHSV